MSSAMVLAMAMCSPATFQAAPPVIVDHTRRTPKPIDPDRISGERLVEMRRKHARRGRR